MKSHYSSVSRPRIPVSSKTSLATPIPATSRPEQWMYHARAALAHENLYGLRPFS
jgi:hypothetical protein